MTRETKIGLLVGLAFIIVIGILLSDHLTSTTEPQQAQLGTVGNSVRNGVTTPGGANPPITQVVTPPQIVAPQQTVPTKEEITPKAPPIEIVKIGGVPQPAPAPQAQHEQQQTSVAKTGSSSAHDQQDAPRPERPVASADSNSPPIARGGADGPSSLAGVAKSMGAEIVPVGQPKDDSTPPATSNETSKEQIASALSHTTGNTAGSQSQTSTTTGGKEYKAEAGDSVSRMAGKFLGGNTKANRDAIIAANPALQQDANKVIVGRTYIIPTSADTAVADSSTDRSAQKTSERATADSAKTQSSGQTAKEASASPEYFYTVKSGDTLTKIAVTQLGTPGAVEAIKDLNKDVLKSSDVIRPNMKLRLPAKPLASAE